MAAWWRLPFEAYAGLPIHCAPGVHAAAAQLLERHAAIRSGVLDLGAGSGAFLARLKNRGFRDLYAIERESARFALPGVQLLPLDLQSDFAASVRASIPRPMSVITALEIIEHLESPLHLLRSAASLLDAGGHLLLTTPNVAQWKSRLKLLLKGEPRYFGLADYNYQRHISPIMPRLIGPMLREAGLDLVEMSTAGTFDGTLKRAVLWPISAAFGKAARGDCIVVLAIKSASKTAE